ncbi:hypothetical protein G6F68_019631 [Rhizopus microsporus]|nr:hypothetical protein G6F68_019631 [Rhizopus microsporus]
MIDDQLLRLPPHLLVQHQKQPKFPADEIPSHLSFITKLVNVHHHLNLILLHFHYTRYPLPHGSTKVVQYPHRDIALSSASAMIRWIESLPWLSVSFLICHPKTVIINGVWISPDDSHSNPPFSRFNPL